MSEDDYPPPNTIAPGQPAFLRELADVLERHDARLFCSNEHYGRILSIVGRDGLQRDITFSSGKPEYLRELAARLEKQIGPEKEGVAP